LGISDFMRLPMPAASIHISNGFIAAQYPLQSHWWRVPVKRKKRAAYATLIRFRIITFRLL
jgi:hypothetical protein